MEIFRASKGIGHFFVVLLIIVSNLGILLLSKLIDLYVILSLIKIFLIVFNIYAIYYFLLAISLKYKIDDESLSIIGIWGLKKVIIPFNKIEAYKSSLGILNGVKLSGIGKNKFAFGRYVLDKIGTTRMFVTNNQTVVYLKAEEINFGVSPEEMERFTKALEKKNIPKVDWENVKKKEVSLHKDRRFMLPFILVSIIIVLQTLIPLILYIKGLLPNEIPLSFNDQFQPLKMGTARQFASKQTTYGVLNMAILLCMYYAAHFHAKYDRKTAQTYIYVSLAVSSVFFLMLIKTIFRFVI
ncbi:hypothetical protein CLHOM_03510 [Clostridium homopropionicum DSM 5847]|uniref:Bacterial Pleckstrin homology domain-containing protein n=1 Tax=Clostridium homopropionicum DSM 5847 TaxID=1121318 RepID=A0A0L6ZE21_9CLOT|nr:PH domain-containing protein [Clostridium homopropionicum]KOA21221.1 hypothetical protein CLHOM_03510 [Clostridium homopropionicum DSM 5847]SFG27801.1 PH domain-containing protein [Clostridium homopropionicum]